MYTPPAFKDEDVESIRATIRDARLANLVTATAEGPLATPLPLFLDESEGERGVIYGHLAKANPQWQVPPIGNAVDLHGSRGLCNAFLVRDQAGDRQGRADLELRRRARVRARRVLPGSRAPARRCDSPDAEARSSACEAMGRLRRSRGFHCRPVARHRRDPHPGGALRRQAQDEPESSNGRSRRRRGGPSRQRASCGPCRGPSNSRACLAFRDTMFELQTFALFLAAATVVAVTPGPGIFYIVARTLAGGRTEGLASSVGLGLGGFVHVLAGAIGISAVVMASAEAFTALKIAGAFYLIWLGLKTWREARVPAPTEVQTTGAGRALREGIVVEALNPKTAAFFLAFIPQFVDTSVNVALQFVVLGTISVALNTDVDLIVTRWAAKA